MAGYSDEQSDYGTPVQDYVGPANHPLPPAPYALITPYHKADEPAPHPADPDYPDYPTSREFRARQKLHSAIYYALVLISCLVIWWGISNVSDSLFSQFLMSWLFSGLVELVVLVGMLQRVPNGNPHLQRARRKQNFRAHLLISLGIAGVVLIVALYLHYPLSFAFPNAPYLVGWNTSLLLHYQFAYHFGRAEYALTNVEDRLLERLRRWRG